MAFVLLIELQVEETDSRRFCRNFFSMPLLPCCYFIVTLVSLQEWKFRVPLLNVTLCQ